MFKKCRRVSLCCSLSILCSLFLLCSSQFQIASSLLRVLHSQGILIVELAHPKNLFSGDFVNGSDFADAWEISEDGSVEFARSDAMVDAELQDEDLDSEQDDNLETNNMKRVLVEYGREGDEFDCSSQILTRTVGMSLFDPSGNLVSSNVSKVPQRQFTLQEINMLADASGFEVVATYGDLDVDIPLESEEAYRMVVVLQNK